MGWLDYLLPRVCAGCGGFASHAARLCEVCFDDLLPIDSPKCPKCATPREVAVGVDALCAECLTSFRSFDAVCAAFEYNGPVASALVRAKVARDPNDFLSICELALARIDLSPYRDWAVLPVPMFGRDLRKRGFSTTQIFSDVLGLRSRQIDCVIKTKRTNLRSKTREERRGEVKHAFVSHPKARIPRKVLVIDDVLTTGATLTAISKVLKKNGAKRVTGIVLARDL